MLRYRLGPQRKGGVSTPPQGGPDPALLLVGRDLWEQQ